MLAEISKKNEVRKEVSKTKNKSVNLGSLTRPLSNLGASVDSETKHKHIGDLSVALSLNARMNLTLDVLYGASVFEVERKQKG